MQVIYGINPLLEIFLSHPAMLEKIVVAEGRERGAVQKILKLAAENGIPVECGGREQGGETGAAPGPPGDCRSLPGACLRHR